jgi:hypothetical protein
MKSFCVPLVIAFALSAAAVLSAGPDQNADKGKKASLKLKASPAIAFSPARVVLTGDLSDGNTNDEALYCAAVEWEWGDGTKSDDMADCDPYVAGKSEVKRHFVTARVFDTSGDYHVTLTLKQKNKVVAFGSTLVKIRPGLRDGGGGGQ